MITKTFEARDAATFIPVLAVKLVPTCEADRYLFARAGFGRSPEQQSEYVILIQIVGGHGQSTCDPYDWNDRTFQAAHEYIIAHFDELESGAVVCVETIRGERDTPKISERLEA